MGGGGQPRAGGDDASDDNESRAAESRAAAEDAEDASSASAPPLPADDSEPCPICLDPPGAGGDEDDDFSLARDVAAISSRVVHAPCCRAAFCRGCLRDYLAAFPRRGCPHCRDVDAFLRGEDVADVAAAVTSAAAPFREISLDIERVAATDADAETNDGAVSSSRPPSSLPAALVGDVSDDFLRPPSSLASDPSASDTPPAALSDDFLRGLAPSETEANLDRTSPAAASFVGAARICEDASLVRRDRRTVDADDVNGLLVALTTRGATVFDAGEEALAALFRDER